MVTYERPPSFARQYAKLTPQQQELFRRALAKFIHALISGEPFPPELRIKRLRRTADLWEMTWDANGRATFRYGEEVNPGEAHVQWMQVGTHDIL